MPVLEESFKNIDEECYQQAYNDHCCQGKIKPEVFFFNPDVARQSSDPSQIIMKKINQDPDENNNDPRHQNIFSCLLVHS